MDEPIGWRARVGILLPSINSVLEPWLYNVAPRGISFHFARMMIRGGVGSVEMIKAMGMEASRAAEEIAALDADVIAYCCTASTLIMGQRYEEQLISKVEGQTGRPTLTATGSMLSALSALKARRLYLVSPYSREIEELEMKYFSECGYEVVCSRGMGLGIDELDKPSPEEICDFAKRGFGGAADCCLVSCLNFRAQGCIGLIVYEIGRTVVTSAQAVFWNILRNLNIKEAVLGYGKLLE
jgi:maleate isomerase